MDDSYQRIILMVLMTSTVWLHIPTRATKMVYGVDPDLTREGGSIPVTLTLQVVLL